MVPYDTQQIRQCRSNLTRLIGKRENGVMEAWIEQHPRCLEKHIQDYGLTATINGLTALAESSDIATPANQRKYIEACRENE